MRFNGFDVIKITFQTNSIYAATTFKRTSSSFGSRLWSDLPLPIDECNDNDIDFHQLPELRRKFNEGDKGLRAISLQPNVTQRVKQPLARNISSPMRFNYTASTKPKAVDRSSVASNASVGSTMSFRNFLRRMSSRRRRPSEASEFHRDKRKSNKATSIR